MSQSVEKDAPVKLQGRALDAAIASMSDAFRRADDARHGRVFPPVEKGQPDA